MIRLGVNIDHVATLRNARGEAHPDILLAAQTAIEAGADGITVHLREDRRHIRDADVWALKRELSVPLNLEMAVTDEMVRIASDLRPHAVCLVPERRNEVTTEGGLDVTANQAGIRAAAAVLARAGCRVSLFIDPEPAQIEAAAAVGAAAIELHTGSFCRRPDDPAEFQRLKDCAALAKARGLECHAGHGLDYDTARRVAGIPEIVELNIGHFLVGAAVFDGLKATVAAMAAAMRDGRQMASGKAAAAPESADADEPLTLFNAWFAEAERREPDLPTAMTLATVGRDGRPSARMVLLKDVSNSGFVFYTNLESRKAVEIAGNPQAALLFHWKSLNRQVRVEGTLERVTNAEADAYFATRPRGAQLGAWASRQSRPLETPLALEMSVAAFTAKYGLGRIPRPSFWSGFRLIPDRIEFWEERPFRLHDRLVFERSGDGWRREKLYP